MKIPGSIIKIFEREIGRLNCGEVSLTVYIRKGKPRIVIKRGMPILSRNLAEGFVRPEWLEDIWKKEQ